MNGRCSLERLRRKSFCLSLLSLLTLCLLLLVIVEYSNITEPLPPQAALDGIQAYQKYNISCPAIYDMDPVEVGKSLVIRREVVEDNDESLINLTSNCPSFIRARGYDVVRVSQQERDFPLAYSIVVHKSALMIERLIKVVYSPSNIYCIHYDQKSSEQFIAAVEGLARCLPNVFIASKRETVVYAGISRLIADLNCLSDLLKSEVQWKYVINLCGQDFPLRSKFEIVSELKKLNGANMQETTRPSEGKKQRFTLSYKVNDLNQTVHTGQKKTPPPHGIEMFVGSAYFVLSREFIVHIDSSAVVKDFLAWSEDTYSPDEHFWATLVRLPGVPGEVPRSHPDITDLMSKTRLVKWQSEEGKWYPQCSGTHVHEICIFGAGELRWLLNYGHWFANKFDPKVDPVIIQCLEEMLEEKQTLI